MKIAVMSDLHLEFGNPFLPKNINNADILILAGDIILAYDLIDQNPKRRKLYNKFFDHISNEYPAILMIGGNHELYRWGIKEINAHGWYIDVIKKYLSSWKNIVFLDNEHVEFGDVRIFGSTFWTDFGNANPLVMQKVELSMNDYKWFYRPDDTLLWHRESMSALEKALDHKKVVVISHMAPSYLSVHPMYQNNILNPAYATELHDWIYDRPQIKYWFHGHMHNNSDYMINSTRVVCNPFGYHQVEKNLYFKPEFFVELESDAGVKEVSEN